MGSVCPPFDYLATCSEPGLESYELSRLNQASNLRKEVRQLLDRWIECEVEARMARLTLESRRTDIRAVASPLPESHAGTLPQQLDLPLLPPDAAVPAVEHRGSSQPRESEDRQRRANRATVVPRAPAKDRVPGGTCVDAEAVVAPALLPCAQPCETRLHDEHDARRNLQLFVRQQTEDSTQRQHSARASRTASFAAASGVAFRVTAHTTSCFSRPGRRDQQPRQISKGSAHCSNVLDRQRRLLHIAEPWRNVSNESRGAYAALCAVQ